MCFFSRHADKSHNLADLLALQLSCCNFNLNKTFCCEKTVSEQQLNTSTPENATVWLDTTVTGLVASRMLDQRCCGSLFHLLLYYIFIFTLTIESMVKLPMNRGNASGS